ncbi:MAG: cyclic nucleotide-binding protein [Xanthobacteraceae bacterium]|nr:cyclic nucleotide-binding protein [Xanthobacteraceae bacterium]
MKRRDYLSSSTYRAVDASSATIILDRVLRLGHERSGNRECASLDENRQLENRLLSFIWRYSAGQQLLLLLLTVASFPILYVSLEIPKFIINGVIQGHDFPRRVLGMEIGQTTFLWLLCLAFLACVFANGVIKMQLSIYRGIVGERLIRRLRFALIAQLMRFPLQRFHSVSQGEVVSMVTAEAEPLTGTMGDAFAQPVFQLGQMLTIIVFLFVQSPWLGLAGIALIPLQAYLIPVMQREVNRMHHRRVAYVRQFSERIGESISGAGDLRINGGAPRRLAEFGHLLGDLFFIRLDIFKRKFLIKFVNNFITQLTPFFFFAVGGYLVIIGQLSAGALIAAIAAARDIADPWRELLLYWNSAQEASSRYEHIVTQFNPPGMLPAALAQGRPDEVPRLDGPLRLDGVTVTDMSGVVLLDQIELEIPARAMVAIKIPDAAVRQALAEVISRIRPPIAGKVEIAGHDVAELHQGVLAARIGVATSTPYIFRSSIAANIQMPLRVAPNAEAADSIGQPPAPDMKLAILEAERAGNDFEPLDRGWFDSGASGLADEQAIRDWWLKIIETMGTSNFLLDRALDCYLEPDRHGALAEQVIGLRTTVAGSLQTAELADRVRHFDENVFNPGLSVGENLLFAVRRRPSSGGLPEFGPVFFQVLEQLDIAGPLIDFAADLTNALVRAFGEVGPRHPLLRRLTHIGPDAFERLRAIDTRRMSGHAFEAADRAILLALPFAITADDLGSGFPAGLEATILEARKKHGATLRALAAEVFQPIESSAFNHNLTVLDNLLSGTLTGSQIDVRRIRSLAQEALIESGLAGEFMLLIGETDTGLGGANLSPVARERIGFARAVIRRPDVLILDHALASQSPAEREAMRTKLRALLPESTIIFLEPDFPQPEAFDLVIEIRGGRIVGSSARLQPMPAPRLSSITADQQSKFDALSAVPEFRGLKRGQIELLAYASRWVSAREGEYLFRSGDETDGAYVAVAGAAELRWPGAGPELEPIDTITPGRLIGDLSVVLDEDRIIDMVAVSDFTALRIGKRELLDIIESDITVALLLLRTVGRHLHGVAEERAEMNAEQGGTAAMMAPRPRGETLQ